MDDEGRAAIPVAFATCGEGLAEATRSEPLAAYASVDVGDDEAADMVQRLRGAPGGGTVGSDRWDRDPDPVVLRSVVSELEGRFLYGLHDRRHFIASTVASLVFDHASAWHAAQAERVRAKSEFIGAAFRFLSSGEDLAAPSRAIDEAMAAGDPEALIELTGCQPTCSSAPLAFVRANRSDVVQRLERFRPRSVAALVDRDDILGASQAHRDAWGLRHRHISFSCVEGQVVEGHGGLLGPVECRRPYLGPAREGHWRAWRQDGPITVRRKDESPALQLADMMASFAHRLRRRTDDDAFDGAEAHYEVHYLGDDEFAPEGWGKATEARSWSQVEMASERDMNWEFEAEQEHRLCDALRLARRIVGRDVRSARDRLLLKMTGRGLGAGATLPLRVEALDVDAFDHLFDRSWTSDTPILKMDSTDANDLWTLARANERSEGFLFSPIEDGRSYGRRGLTRSEYDAILHARLAETAPLQIAAMLA